GGHVQLRPARTPVARRTSRAPAVGVHSGAREDVSQSPELRGGQGLGGPHLVRRVPRGGLQPARGNGV
ncbi:unnamed protein product, partial [Prorocentrum cordatum]